MKVKISGSFRRYKIATGKCEKTPDPLQENLGRALFEARFQSIDNRRGELNSVGWTDVEGLVPADFDDLDPWYGSTLCLGLRIDVKRVAGQALRVRRLEAEAAERREVGERIPPERRREITEKLEQELLGRCIPATSVHQVLWDTRTGQLLFSATADAPNAAFRSLFRETFGRVAEPVTPANAAVRLLGRSARSVLKHLVPANFSP